MRDGTEFVVIQFAESRVDLMRQGQEEIFSRRGHDIEKRKRTFPGTGTCWRREIMTFLVLTFRCVVLAISSVRLARRILTFREIYIKLEQLKKS